MTVVAPRRIGRPSKLTPPIQDAVVTVLRNTGCSRAMAARHVEVDPETFYEWMKRNAGFRRAVSKAENDYDLGLLARARTHATRDSKAATWLIEHSPRLRAEWAPKAEMGVTLSGPDGQAPQVEVKVTHGLAIGAGERLAALASVLDVLERVGVLPDFGAAGSGPDHALTLVGTEVVEVHPEDT